MAHTLQQVNFWDIRVERLMKKGRKAEDALDLVWKPTHAIHLISLIGVCPPPWLTLCLPVTTWSASNFNNLALHLGLLSRPRMCL